MINLKNTNIVLTGATGGIGNSILEKLVNAEANILATGTNEVKLENRYVTKHWKLKSQRHQKHIMNIIKVHNSGVRQNVPKFNRVYTYEEVAQWHSAHFACRRS